jgi:hypothetical protein
LTVEFGVTFEQRIDRNILRPDLKRSQRVVIKSGEFFKQFFAFHFLTGTANKKSNKNSLEWALNYPFEVSSASLLRTEN